MRSSPISFFLLLLPVSAAILLAGTGCGNASSPDAYKAGTLKTESCQDQPKTPAVQGGAQQGEQGPIPFDLNSLVHGETSNSDEAYLTGARLVEELGGWDSAFKTGSYTVLTYHRHKITFVLDQATGRVTHVSPIVPGDP